MAGVVRQGWARHGEAWQGRAGMVRLGLAGPGLARHGRQGMGGFGKVRWGKAWQAWIGNTTTQQHESRQRQWI